MKWLLAVAAVIGPLLFSEEPRKPATARAAELAFTVRGNRCTRPGTYAIAPGEKVTLILVILRSGGLSRPPAEAKIFRRGPQDETVITVNLRGLLNGELTDPIIRDGDIIDFSVKPINF